MHERDRHRVILSALRDNAVATVSEISQLTGASEATIRRDIIALDAAGHLRRVRGGAEAITPVSVTALAGPRYEANAELRRPEKTAIARAAAALCKDGEPIILNGGTTTYEMVHFLAPKTLKILTNSLPIANYLMQHSQNQLLMPGGAIYREQNIILSSFKEDATGHFWAKRMFMGCHGIAPVGIMEIDPLLIRAEEKLMMRADELVILADSTKLRNRSSLVLCPLSRVHTLVTDDEIPDADAARIEAEGVQLIVTSAKAAASERPLSPGVPG
ncbi:DeoR/GlpR family DNA-binding transcription regulator [Stappia sp.]|uniref:DeoR/GlpR family DNA-binding transcription regulator n=1 Tax=Stappia sp. TaxID=1870903 RepID=UPI0032D95DDA